MMLRSVQATIPNEPPTSKHWNHVRPGLHLGRTGLSPKSKQIGTHLAHLDLLRPFSNAVPAEVAIDVLERVVSRVSVAAVDLSSACESA